jgi:hypothetical protein
MAGANTPAQIRQLIQHRDDRGGIQKIRRKPKLFNPNVDKRNSNKNKTKESFGSEGV